MAAITLEVFRNMQGPPKTVRLAGTVAPTTVDLVAAGTNGYAVLLVSGGTTAAGNLTFLDGATSELTIVLGSNGHHTVLGPIVRVDSNTAQTAPLIYVPPGNALRINLTGTGTWQVNAVYVEVTP